MPQNAVVIAFPGTNTAAPPPPPPSERLEPLIGECMAAAAIQVLFDAAEYEAGRRVPWVGQRTEGGDRIAELYELRQVALMTGELYADFEQVARVHGIAALCKRANGRLSMRMIGILIDGVLEVLGKVVQSQIN